LVFISVSKRHRIEDRTPRLTTDVGYLEDPLSCCKVQDSVQKVLVYNSRLERLISHCTLDGVPGGDLYKKGLNTSLLFDMI